MEGGNALARILFGDVNPSGKLPFTVPKSENDLPPFNSFDTAVEYGYYHGYTLLEKEHKVPRYSFGFGLSYTSFLISDLKIEFSDTGLTDTLHVSVKVKNTGNRNGAEVVQLYIGFPHSAIERPKKLLRGFEKIYLSESEEQTLSFKISVDELPIHTLYSIFSTIHVLVAGS